MVGKGEVLVLIRLVGLLLLLSGGPVMADCDGCNQTINLTLSNTLDSQTNAPGQTQASSMFTVGSLHTGLTGIQSASFSNIDGSIPPYGTAPSDWVYQRVDDYLSVAVRLQQTCGYIYAPFNRQSWAFNTCQPSSFLAEYWGSTGWQSSIQITRKMIGGVYRNSVFLGTWGGCPGLCSSPTQHYANVYLNYSITVPENCVLNADQIVTVNFGNISTGAFRAAGAKADGVNPLVRAIGLQCSNIQQQASLSMRVQADNVNGNTIVSDNPDVGFVVTDNSNNALTPNLISSMIPFKLDASGRANVTIKVYPASVTGNKPAEGPVTSRAYLRVDFQ